MAQTSNNNLTCLPLYKTEGEISSNLPWAYGDIFPLRCDKRLLPFFGLRKKSTTTGAGEEISESTYGKGILTAAGEWDETAAVDYGVSDFDGIETSIAYIGAREGVVWVENLPIPPIVSGVETANVVWKDADGNILRVQTAETAGEQYYSGFLYAPTNAAELLILSYDGIEKATLHKAADVARPINTVTLIDTEGNQTELSVAKAIKVVNIGDNDLFYYSGETDLLSGIERGTYRMLLMASSSPDDRYYSDWFTWGGVPKVRIEWYDVNDTQFEGGYIPYSLGYRNRIWLNTSVGFPEYEIDKEGDERNGTFFMEKGVSRKSYKMSFYAPEYLCDVLRLVPVSDYVKIYDTSRGKEIEYDVDDIDMEVEWQETGNYATVTFTFKTDTVVKNLGKII